MFSCRVEKYGSREIVGISEREGSPVVVEKDSSIKCRVDLVSTSGWQIFKDTNKSEYRLFSLNTDNTAKIRKYFFCVFFFFVSYPSSRIHHINTLEVSIHREDLRKSEELDTRNFKVSERGKLTK